MSFQPASSASVAAFVAILIAVVVALVAGIYRASGSTRATGLAVLALGIWLGFLGALVASGRLSALPFGGLPFFFGSVLLVAVGAGFSPLGRTLATGLPVSVLLGFQAFRLPLELVLHSWAEQGTVPPTMTWTGQNWDIVSGTLALVVAPLSQHLPKATRLANLIGFGLLLNVIRVAVMSSPLPFAWDTRPPLLLAYHLPYTFIGPICVGGALFGHIVLFRALALEKLKVGR